MSAQPPGSLTVLGVLLGQCYTSHTDGPDVGLRKGAESSGIAPWEPIAALVSGLPRQEREERRLVMLQAYVDDSGNGQPPVFVLGGFVSSVERWMAFSDAWRLRLDESPSIAFFKAKQAAALTGQFAGWTAEDRDAKVRSLVAIINEFSIVGLACVVPYADYDDIFKSKISKKMDSPYVFAFYGIIQLLMIAQNRAGDNRPADFVFDEQGKKIGQALEAWKYWTEFAPPEARKLMGKPPISGDDMSILPLQAADLLAWRMRRVVAQQRYGEPAHPMVCVSELKSVISEFWGRPKLIKMMDALQSMARETGRKFDYDIKPPRNRRN